MNTTEKKPVKPQEVTCTVSFNRMVTPTVFELGFETTPSFEFKAGQFVSVVVPGAGPQGRDLRRAYSIASTPGKNPIELCIKLVEGGPGTQYLYKQKPGDQFKVWAPYGDFVYKHKADRHVCFIATGTGLAPFRAMVLSKEYQAQPPVSATCLFGVRSPEELLYEKELSQLKGLKWVPAISQPADQWHGFKGRVTDYLKTMDHPWMNSDYYLCGNGGMITEVKAFLQAKGITKDSIYQEIYYK
jgi:CDP-4-dehydro-6-deoxyglucose reductase, E3